MSRRRSPAKMKAEIDALEAAPPPEPFHSPLDIRRRISLALLCVLSSFLMLISFAPFDYGAVAYVALVPWGLAVIGARKRRLVLLWAYLGGVVFWVAGLYWLTWMALVGYVPLVLYLGAYWLVAAAVVRKAFARGIPTWLALPVVWVALEYARAFALSGFTWFYLAHSQYQWIRLIQVSDLTGQYGVSFFVAMVNGAIIDVLAQPIFVRTRRGRGRITRRMLVAVGACAATAAAMLAYGSWRLAQQPTRPGPKLGVVQMAFPVSLADGPNDPKEIFDAHLQSSAELLRKDCDLIVWPESMLGDPDMARLEGLVKDAGCPLLAGAAMPSGQVDVRCPGCGYRWQVGEGLLRPVVTCAACGKAFPRDGHLDHIPANSAVMFDLDEQGRLRLRDRYDKMHLVPFSECVPFRRGWRWFHDQLRRCVPEPMHQLEPGRHRVWFEIDSAGGKIELAVPICYEGTFARVCRRLVMHNGRKRCQVLVNISNDGWFIRKYDGGRKVHASTELAQHLVQYVFRAVENRLPVIRAVNTGVSAHIDSNGVIGQTVSNEGRREMAVGNLEVETLVDTRTSSYSKHGDIFALLVCVASGGILVKVFWRRRGRDLKRE